MTCTDEERAKADSLAAEYWDAVVRQRNKVDTISSEESSPQHQGPDFQVTMSRMVDQLLESSKLGSLDVWFMIGDAYQTGTGTKRNQEQALRWFRKAAVAEHIGSMVRLACALKHPDHKKPGQSLLHGSRRRQTRVMPAPCRYWAPHTVKAEVSPKITNKP